MKEKILKEFDKVWDAIGKTWDIRSENHRKQMIQFIDENVDQSYSQGRLDREREIFDLIEAEVRKMRKDRPGLAGLSAAVREVKLSLDKTDNKKGKQ